MKVIISHDIDHISVWEHKKDLIIPKFIVRAFLEYSFGYISIWEVKERFRSLKTNCWQCIDEVMAFDRTNGIPSTFFIGVRNGRYLAYDETAAKPWIDRIIREGFDVGVHGIAFDDIEKMAEEHNVFARLSNLSGFGIRMHYLQTSPDTLQFLDKIGYAFDSTVMTMKDPYRIGTMWELPLHVMDGYMLCDKSRWQNRNLSQACESTMACFRLAQKQGIQYFTVLFHDRYFCDAFRSWKDWYIWMVGYCRENGMGFISFKDAIAEQQC